MRPHTSWPILKAWIRTTSMAGGKSPWRQWPEIIWLFGRHGLTVGEYFNYGFHRRGHAIRWARDYFGEHWFGRKFYSRIAPAERMLLADKVLFQLVYQAHGIPFPRLLCWALPAANAIFDAARGLQFASLGAWISQTRPASMVIKPVLGMQGQGIHIFKTLDYENGRAVGLTGGRERLGVEEVLARMEKAAPPGVIIQEYVHQHRELARLNAGKSVNTARVLTHLRPNGELRLLGASLRYAVDEDVDNWHAGGVSARIDPATGRIGSGLLMTPGPRTLVAHAVPSDWTFPFWPDVLDLVRKAALVRPAVSLVGWDVACTEAGPVLIEGNYDPDVHLIQDHGTSLFDAAMRADLRALGVKMGRLHR